MSWDYAKSPNLCCSNLSLRPTAAPRPLCSSLVDPSADCLPTGKRHQIGSDIHIYLYARIYASGFSSHLAVLTTCWQLQRGALQLMSIISQTVATCRLVQLLLRLPLLLVLPLTLTLEWRQWNSCWLWQVKARLRFRFRFRSSRCCNNRARVEAGAATNCKCIYKSR